MLAICKYPQVQILWDDTFIVVVSPDSFTNASTFLANHLSRWEKAATGTWT